MLSINIIYLDLGYYLARWWFGTQYFRWGKPELILVSGSQWWSQISSLVTRRAETSVLAMYISRSSWLDSWHPCMVMIVSIWQIRLNCLDCHKLQYKQVRQLWFDDHLVIVSQHGRPGWSSKQSCLSLKSLLTKFATVEWFGLLLLYTS